MKEKVSQQGKKPTAIVLTDGLLTEPDAKTAHGLIRGTERFEIIAIIDSRHAGKDAGELLDGTHRNIPILATVEAAVAHFEKIDYCIIGVATIGGAFPAHFPGIVESCIRQGISIVNGLHEFLTERPEMVALAAANAVELIDVRKPKRKADLHFWSGKIFSVTAPVIAVIGMDCAMGKRTTCRMVRQACEAAGLNAQMIYTGQTGWLQGGRFGFIFDSTLNDFISGELEHAIISCWEATRPDIILLEGQSALRNPSGPCGSELLVSGNARHVILIAAPKRKYYEDDPAWGPLPSVQSEIALIRMYGAAVIALALNTEHCSPEEAVEFRDHYERELQIPVLLPLQEGVAGVVPVITHLINRPKL
ncbi:MAG TPA: DUF1611 domain-containing protein [Puia sp.]|nr:DUF1611 domain-containing protein [Puia sp.]